MAKRVPEPVVRLPFSGRPKRDANGIPLAAKAKRQEGPRTMIEGALSIEDWRHVYEAFEKTGQVAELVTLTGKPKAHVNYLLDYGIPRLGLRPVREVATDCGEVACRTQKALEYGAYKAVLASKRKVTDAVADRAVRETVVAQSVLQAAVQTTDLLLGYANKLVEKVAQSGEDGGFEVPEKVKLSHLEALTRAINALAQATSKAIEQSRLTAGEPTQHIAVQVGAFVAALQPDELRRFVSTGALPSHMLLRGGSRDATEDGAPKAASSLPVIEGEVVDDG